LCSCRWQICEIRLYQLALRSDDSKIRLSDKNMLILGHYIILILLSKKRVKSLPESHGPIAQNIDRRRRLSIFCAHRAALSRCVVKQSCPRNACRVTLSPWFDVWMITGSKDCTTDVRDCFRWRTPSSSGRQCRLRLLTLASASPLPPVGYTASARSSSSLFIYRTETPYT